MKNSDFVTPLCGGDFTGRTSIHLTARKLAQSIDKLLAAWESAAIGSDDQADVEAIVDALHYVNTAIRCVLDIGDIPPENGEPSHGV